MSSPKLKTETPPVRETKSAIVIGLLRWIKGATIDDITAATAWQPHSARAFLSGLRKKGYEIVREERKSGKIAYRIVKTPSAK